jgi:hypothetical protein
MAHYPSGRGMRLKIVSGWVRIPGGPPFLSFNAKKEIKMIITLLLMGAAGFAGWRYSEYKNDKTRFGR